MSDYFQRVALNASTAKRLLVSPAQARYALDNPTEPTPAMRRGTRLHMAVLEPERFKGICILGPDLSGMRTKSGEIAKNPAATVEGKAIIARFREDNPDADILTEDEMTETLAMRDALLASEVGPLFADAECEAEVYWSRDGVDLKAKLDALPAGCIIDLKTYSGDWTLDKIQRTALDHGWPIQSTHYQEAARVHVGVELPFLFAVVQASAPYEVAILRCTDAFLAHGRAQMDKAIAIWRTCMASGHWPTAQTMGAIGMDLDLPGWVARQTERAESREVDAATVAALEEAFNG